MSPTMATFSAGSEISEAECEAKAKSSRKWISHLLGDANVP